MSVTDRTDVTVWYNPRPSPLSSGRTVCSGYDLCYCGVEVSTLPMTTNYSNYLLVCSTVAGARVQVYRLMQDYGDHYDPYFGVDSRARLAGDLDAGMRCSIATHRVRSPWPSSYLLTLVTGGCRGG